MVLVNNFLNYAVFSEKTSSRHRISDPENSTFLKVAACIPLFGTIINQIQSKSLEEKFSALPLPKRLRPSPELGKVLNINASPEEVKKACERAIQLKSIQRDYSKASLVNSLLTTALAVYALAMNVIPSLAAGILICGFGLISAVITFVLCSDDSINRYEKVRSACV